MKILEILPLLYMALMIIVTTRWINRVKNGMISVFNQKLVILTLTGVVLAEKIFLPTPPIERIGFITLCLMVLIYLLNLGTRTQEEARMWIGWSLFWLGLTGLMALVIDRLTTNRESETLFIVTAVTTLTPAYSWIATTIENRG